MEFNKVCQTNTILPLFQMISLAVSLLAEDGTKFIVLMDRVSGSIIHHKIYNNRVLCEHLHLM